MIKVENMETYGWESAIRGMRNPMNSWEKSDTVFLPMQYCDEDGELELAEKCHRIAPIIRDNDYDLMKKLCKAGTDHRKFMRMINVAMDITAPLYWWKEWDTYKVGTVANSCSTMHKIQAKEFTIDDFSCEHLLNTSPLHSPYAELTRTIYELNFWRDRFNDSETDRKDYFNFNGYPEVPSKKECWWQMIQLLPSSYNQKRTVQLNYEVLANMYKSRKAHKLDEWREFCKIIETLPYSELITGEQ